MQRPRSRPYLSRYGRSLRPCLAAPIIRLATGDHPEPSSERAIRSPSIPKGASMRLQVKAHHGHLSEPVRAYAEKRLAKLDRRLHDLTFVEVTLSREYNPSIADDHTAEGVLHTNGPTLVARESAPTYEAAVARLVDTLERQIER